MNSEEKSYQKKYCDKYFGKNNWDQEVLNRVDVLLKGKRGESLLYIEFKYRISAINNHRKALAQTILTNKKQKHILDRVALAYMDVEGNDVLELIDCSDNSVMYNNDINWEAETASEPSKDAIDRINDRIKDKIARYINDDIRELYLSLRNGEGSEIQITEHNFNVVYNQWKSVIKFVRDEKDEQELINLFLTDILNGTKYELRVKIDIIEPTLFGSEKVGEEYEGTGIPLMREGTNLSKYELERYNGKVRIVYDNYIIHAIHNSEGYDTFWRKYKRPPEQDVYMKILEHSAELYTDQYRRDTGGEYTPTCFVELQNQILAKYYNLDDYIVCDPCSGVGNLENQFGKEYKQYCYLSTLEQMDVDICHIKGFENAVCYNYLKDNKQPKWKYRGEKLGINEIAERENRKLMVIMNPPYTRQKGHKQDLAIEFFNKVLALKPDVIVYYCKTEFFLRSTVSNYVDSGYNIVSHVFSNAKETFKLSEWSISQIIFDRNEGKVFNGDYVTAERYELDRKDQKLHFVKTYTYDNKRPSLIKSVEGVIKDNADGMTLGQWTNQNYCLVLSNRTDSSRLISTNNLKYCLLLKGINFNTHGKYFETSNLTYRGTFSEISSELFSDAVMFSLFYKGFLFTNKSQKNYIMPFTADELGCGRNDLNVLFPSGDANLFAEKGEKPFDFREFMSQFDFSIEAKALYDAALKVFHYYHCSELYQEKDWNDSYYDIANAIMDKDVIKFQTMDKISDRRITKVKTTKGTRGFGRKAVAEFVPENSLPMFYDFFDKRDTLAMKINKELLESRLLLWKRENIF